jgi:hypothetical protein
VSSRKLLREDFEENGFDINKLLQTYLEWVFDDKYLILVRYKSKTILVKNSKTNEMLQIDLPDPQNEAEVFAIKCSKRGNDVYRSRVYRRFKEPFSLIKNLVFFNRKIRRNRKTRALFVTLSYDTKRCSLEEAWVNIGVEFNRFMSNLRKKFARALERILAD